MTNDFKTNCINGGLHIPTSEQILNICGLCNQSIHETSEYSGYWFTDEDDKNWDKMYNGEIEING